MIGNMPVGGPLEWPKTVTDIVFHVVSVVATLVALATYRRSARTRRAEWLLSLHHKFFESSRHQTIRRILDYRPRQELSDLVAGITSGEWTDDVERLYDYLNFFEFVAHLWKLKQITKAEVLSLFEYYLRNIATHDFPSWFDANEGD